MMKHTIVWLLAGLLVCGMAWAGGDDAADDKAAAAKQKALKGAERSVKNAENAVKKYEAMVAKETDPEYKKALEEALALSKQYLEKQQAFQTALANDDAEGAKTARNDANAIYAQIRVSGIKVRYVGDISRLRKKQTEFQEDADLSAACERAIKAMSELIAIHEQIAAKEQEVAAARAAAEQKYVEVRKANAPKPKKKERAPKAKKEKAPKKADEAGDDAAAPAVTF